MVEKKKKRIEYIPVKIIDEGRKTGKQLSIRLPKRVADALEIDPKKDIFIFELDKEELHLTGELVDKEKYEKEKLKWEKYILMKT